MTETPNLPAERKPQLHAGGAVAALVPQTLDEAYRLADAMSRSGLTPNGIKTPEAVLMAVMAGSEVGFAPYQSVQSIAIINGRPCLWGDAIPALLWNNGFDIEETFENEGDDFPDTMKAVCVVTRPGGRVISRNFSVADAKRGKLWEKRGREGQDTPWITSPKRMLQMRARGFAARDGAADVLRGLYIAEEAQDIAPAADVETGTGLVARLNARTRPADVDPDGFNVRSVTAETEAAKPRGRKGKAADPPPIDAEFEDGGKAAQEPQGSAETGAGASDAQSDGAEQTGAGERPTRTDAAQPAASDRDTSGSANDASLASLDPKGSGPQAQEPPSEDGAENDDAEEVHQHEAPTMPGPLALAIDEFRDTCQGAESWLQIKAAIGKLKRMREFMELPEDMQIAEGVYAYQHGAMLAAAERDPVSTANDASFYSLWLQTKPLASEVTRVFQQLCRSPVYRGLKDEQKDAIAQATREATGDLG